jgi:hypothetical protein
MKYRLIGLLSMTALLSSSGVVLAGVPLPHASQEYCRYLVTTDPVTGINYCTGYVVYCTGQVTTSYTIADTPLLVQLCQNANVYCQNSVNGGGLCPKP